MQSLVSLTQLDSDNGMDVVNELKNSLAFQLCSPDEFTEFVAGSLSHQTIRMLSAKIEGIAAYKGLDMVVEETYQDSDGMYQVLAKSALT